MEQLENRFRGLELYSTLDEVYTHAFEDKELCLYVNCLYALFKYLKHPRYILECFVTYNNRYLNLPTQIIRDFFMLGCQIRMKEQDVPSVQLYSNYQCMLMSTYITPNIILKDWFASYLYNSNLVHLMNPAAGTSHIIEFQFVTDMNDITESVTTGFNLCKFCIPIVCRIRNEPLIKLREMSHYTTVDRYPFIRLKQRAFWCKLCKRTPLLRIMSQDACVVECGLRLHRCGCPNKDCLWCDNGFAKLWTLYDTPELTMSFRRCMDKEFPNTLRARRRLQFVSTNFV